MLLFYLCITTPWEEVYDFKKGKKKKAAEGGSQMGVPDRSSAVYSRALYSFFFRPPPPSSYSRLYFALFDQPWRLQDE